MYKYKRNGFTLVELMAVIIIISLIALLTFPNIINQIKKTKKSNNKMIEDVVIEQAKKYVNDNNDELLEDEYCMPISTLIDNDYIKEDIVNINNIKDNKVVHITLDNNNSYEVVDKNKCFLSAVKYLLKKTNPITVTNYTDGDIHEMYTFEHEATVQTPALTDYRYIGSDPNNYVEFNNEIWRIIGVFKVEDESGKWKERIKIVRNSSLGNMKWDENNTNEWSTATLNTYLNGEYYNGIDNSSKQTIDTIKYFLGGRSYNASSHYGTGNDMYSYERSNNVYASNTNYFISKIALMYPSDYIFTYSLGVNSVCFNDGLNCAVGNGGDPTSSWMIFLNNVQWLLSHYNENSTTVLSIDNSKIWGKLVTLNFSVTPTLYLSSKVKITSGDGTESNPYKLSM